MRLLIVLLFAVLSMTDSASAVPVMAKVGPPALSGSIYQNASRTNVSNAMVAVSVYLRLADPTTQNPWLGPVLTDQFGRFVFDNIPPGRYLLRAYDVNSYRLWEQVVGVPSQLQPIVIRDILVTYYPKASDGDSVAGTLQQLAYPYKEEAPVNQLPTNSIWFGDAVPIDDVRAIAGALIKAGVRLTAVRRFKNGSGSKLKMIEVGSSPEHAKLRPLQLSAVLAAKSFPRAK
jgi:hypothetical protein